MCKSRQASKRDRKQLRGKHRDRGPQGVRERTLSGPTCEQVIEAAALVIALDWECRTRPARRRTEGCGECDFKRQLVKVRRLAWKYAVGATLASGGCCSKLARPVHGEVGLKPPKERPMGACERVCPWNHNGTREFLVDSARPLIKSKSANVEFRTLAPFAMVCPVLHGNARSVVVNACLRLESETHSASASGASQTNFMINTGMSIRARLRIVEGLGVELESGFLGT